MHDTARVSEAFRRAVLRRFVRLERVDDAQAAGMLTWPHSGFHVHTPVWAPEEDRAFATRLARYCARNPLALDQPTARDAGEGGARRGAMRIVVFITQGSVIDQILAPRRVRSPTLTQVPAALQAPERDRRHVAACRATGFECLDTNQSYLDVPDAAFDLVRCRHALEHRVAPYFTLAGFRRVLTPGGTLYVAVPAPDTYWGIILRRSRAAERGRPGLAE